MLIVSFDPTQGTPENNVIQIVGTGTISGIAIQLSGDLNFGDVPDNGFVTALLEIQNPGTANLTVTSISYPLGFSGVFSGVILPGATQSVQVTFAPTSPILYSGNLTVNSNSATGVNTLAMSGNGVALPQPLALIPGQFVSLVDERGSQTFYNFYSVVSMSGTNLVLMLLDQTMSMMLRLILPADGRAFLPLMQMKPERLKLSAIYKMAQSLK